MHESSHPGTAIKIRNQSLNDSTDHENISLSFCLKFNRYVNMVEPDKVILVFLLYLFIYFF